MYIYILHVYIHLTYIYTSYIYILCIYITTLSISQHRCDRGNILRQVAGETDKTCWSWEVADDSMQLRLGGHDAALGEETLVKGMNNHRQYMYIHKMM